jgi:hypothetical protein
VRTAGPRYQKYLFDLKVEFSNDRWSLGSLNQPF